MLRRRPLYAAIALCCMSVAALLYSAIALCLHCVAWFVSTAAVVFDQLNGKKELAALPVTFVNVSILNRKEKLAEMEERTRAEVAERAKGLGPFADIAAGLVSKAAAGLAAAAVSDRDLGMSIGLMVSDALPAMLEQVGIRSEAQVVYAEGALAVVECRMTKVDLRQILSVATQSSLGIGMGRAWGACWDACELVGLGAFFERVTEARIGELAAFGLVQALSADLETVVRKEMDGLEVAVTTLQAERQAEHFFGARRQLGMAVAAGASA